MNGVRTKTGKVVWAQSLEQYRDSLPERMPPPKVQEMYLYRVAKAIAEGAPVSDTVLRQYRLLAKAADMSVAAYGGRAAYQVSLRELLGQNFDVREMPVWDENWFVRSGPMYDTDNLRIIDVRIGEGYYMVGGSPLRAVPEYGIAQDTQYDRWLLLKRYVDSETHERSDWTEVGECRPDATGIFVSERGHGVGRAFIKALLLDGAFPKAQVYSDDVYAAVRSAHKQIIRDAVEMSHLIPEAVIADYPDLRQEVPDKFILHEGKEAGAAADIYYRGVRPGNDPFQHKSYGIFLTTKMSTAESYARGGGEVKAYRVDTSNFILPNAIEVGMAKFGGGKELIESQKMAAYRARKLGAPGIIYDGGEMIAVLDKKVMTEVPLESAKAAAASSDVEYLAAAEAKDLERCQAMVDAAAKSAGYTIGPVWHGTQADFTEFSIKKTTDKQGKELGLGWGKGIFWFSESKGEALKYARPGRGKGYAEGTPKTLSVYLKVVKPWTLGGYGGEHYGDYQAVRDGYAEWSSVQPRSRRFELFKKQIRSEGCDAIILQGQPARQTDVISMDATPGEIGVFSPSQIKSADPVTYDDAGNIIPLSQRFDSSKSDIRAERRKIGDVGVDSGVLAITDPCYVVNKGGAEPRAIDRVVKDWDTFLNETQYVKSPTNVPYAAGHDGLMFVTPAGGHDGNYEVFGEYDEDGNLLEVVVPLRERQASIDARTVNSMPWYHGTNEPGGIRVFRKTRRGAAYFNGDIAHAAVYGNHIFEVELSVNNTWDYKDPADVEKLMLVLRSLPGYEKWMDDELRGGDWEILERRQIQAALKNLGYDSYMASGDGEYSIGVLGGGMKVQVVRDFWVDSAGNEIEAGSEEIDELKRSRAFRDDVKVVEDDSPMARQLELWSKYAEMAVKCPEFAELYQWIDEVFGEFSKILLCDVGFECDEPPCGYCGAEVGRYPYARFWIESENNRYSIVAHGVGGCHSRTYLGCTQGSKRYDTAEDWTRGHDLPDGTLTYDTWLRIVFAMLRDEVQTYLPGGIRVVPRSVWNKEQGIGDLPSIGFADLTPLTMTAPGPEQSQEFIDVLKAKLGQAGKKKFKELKHGLTRDGKHYGVGISEDKDCFFAHTHRARSKSYESVDKIPKNVLRFIDSTGARHARAMQVFLGNKGLGQSWQKEFPAESRCCRCGAPARIAFVAREMPGEKGPGIADLHERNRDGNGGLWLHDAGAFAVYLCTECLEPTAKYNQAAQKRVIAEPAAYHGSPHDFDEFTTKKIGTGEGEQAYGWGLYFAGRKEVAEWYRKSLSNARIKTIKYGRQYTYNINKKKTVWEKQYGVGGMEEIVDYLVSLFNKYGDDIAAMRKDASDMFFGYRLYWAKEAYLLLSDAISIEHLGSLYEVDLRPTDEQFLDWDKVLAEGSSSVAKKIKPLISVEEGGRSILVAGRHLIATKEVVNEEQAFNVVLSSLTGQFFYEKLSIALHSQKEASLKLLSLGVRGIRYLDATSREDGSGTYNYVIFDENDVQITRKASVTSAAWGQQLVAALVDDGWVPFDSPLVSVGKIGAGGGSTALKKGATVVWLSDHTEVRRPDGVHVVDYSVDGSAGKASEGFKCVHVPQEIGLQQAVAMVDALQNEKEAAARDDLLRPLPPARPKPVCPQCGSNETRWREFGADTDYNGMELFCPHCSRSWEEDELPRMKQIAAKNESVRVMVFTDDPEKHNDLCACFSSMERYNCGMSRTVSVFERAGDEWSEISPRPFFDGDGSARIDITAVQSNDEPADEYSFDMICSKQAWDECVKPVLDYAKTRPEIRIVLEDAGENDKDKPYNFTIAEYQSEKTKQTPVVLRYEIIPDEKREEMPLSESGYYALTSTGNKKEKSLYVYDFDGTLVDTGEFKQDRIDDPKPITKNLDALKKRLKDGDSVMVLTARSKAELVRSTLADFGIDTKGLKIVALGDPSNGAKGQYLKKHVADKYSKVVLYDDRQQYIDGVKDALEETGSRFKGVLAAREPRKDIRARILGK